jgi:thymidylate synthase
MNNLDKTYTDLLQDILDNGVTKSDRTGTGTISIFGRQIRHKMSDGFPLLTTKKMPFKTIVTELLWFLRGDTNIKYLVDNGCHIWDGDCFSNYQKITAREIKLNIAMETHPHYGLTKEEFINRIKTDVEFAKQWGNLGSIYGKQWRSWETYDFSIDNDFGNNEFGGGWNVKHIDQISNLINDLKTNPDSRRLMVNAWNVGELDQMVLPPCHYGFQVYTRELSYEERRKLCKVSDRVYPDDTWMEEHNVPTRSISLMWNQRSVDTFLGLPFNIASYGLLLEIIAKAVNMVPDELIGNLGDVHLYSNHVEQAKEQIGRELSLDERLKLAANDIHFNPDFGIAHHIESFCQYTIDEYGIPRRTRQPFPLPTLKHMKTEAFYKSLSEDVSLVIHLDNTDFEMENYQAHPTIKAPLSN